MSMLIQRFNSILVPTKLSCFKMGSTHLFYFLLLTKGSLLPRVSLITFRVSRRPREMYCGHARLCVCVSVRGCMHAHTVARTQM